MPGILSTVGFVLLLPGVTAVAPPQLGRRVERFRLVKSGPVRLVDQLMRRLGVRATVEVAGKYLSEVDLRAERGFSLFCRNVTLRELLDILVELDWRYDWDVSGGFVHFLPSVGGRDPDYVMNRQVDAFEMAEDDMYAFLRGLQRRLGNDLGIQFVSPTERSVINLAAGDLSFVGPIHVSFPGGTLRDLADAVAATQPDGYWYFICREAIRRMSQVEKSSWDYLVLVNVPVLKDTPTKELLEALKEYGPGRAVSMRLFDISDELKARAHDEVVGLIRAYRDPANKPYIYLKAYTVGAIATVRSTRVRRFLLKELRNVQEDEPDLVEALGNAVSSTQPIQEALPLLRKLASSKTAEERVRKAAQVYVRILLAKFPESRHKDH